VSRTVTSTRPPAHAHLDAHGAAGRRVAQRVRDEVREDLPDADRVGVDRGGALGARAERDAGALRLIGERPRDVTRDRLQLDRLPVQRERAALGQREGAQVVDEPGEHLRLLEEHRDVLAIDRSHAIEERLDVALHDRERRPQLVGHVGEELLPL